MTFEVTRKDNSIELDNGVQYISLSIEDAEKLIAQIKSKLVTPVEENLKKDWNYLGGL